jgi:ABC-2 type transport system permease protein
MRNFWALFKVTLKNTFGITETGKQKTFLQKLFPIFLLVAIAPTIASFYFLTGDALALLKPIQQTGVIIGLLLTMLSTLIFFLAIFLIPAVFYFSKDVETLLSLPLKASTILSAKLAVSMIYEYITILAIGIPVILAYMVNVQPPLGFYPLLLLSIVLLPVVPLTLSGLLVMAVMALIPKARNRDLFNYISGFISLGFAVGINMVVGNIATISADEMVQLLIQGNNSFLAIFGYLIPSVPFAAKAVVNLSLIDFLISAAIAVGAYLLFLLIAELAYFRAAVGVNETGANRRKLNGKAYLSSTQGADPVWTYTLKELKLMIRTPIYLLNNISTVILIPAILVGTLMTTAGQQDELISLVQSIDWNAPGMFAYVMTAGLAIGLFMTSLNLITVTAISREGTRLFFMKYIPMSYNAQIQAKVNSGLLVSIIGILFMTIPFGIVFAIPWIQIALAIGMALLASVFLNYFGMIVDMIHPKLIWEQEAVPVKQNINAVFTMLPGMGLPVAAFMILNWLKNDTLFLIILVVLLIALDVAAIVATRKIATSSIEKLS